MLSSYCNSQRDSCSNGYCYVVVATCCRGSQPDSYSSSESALPDTTDEWDASHGIGLRFQKKLAVSVLVGGSHSTYLLTEVVICRMSQRQMEGHFWTKIFRRKAILLPLRLVTSSQDCSLGQIHVLHYYCRKSTVVFTE